MSDTKFTLRKSEALMLAKGEERLKRMIRNALEKEVFDGNQKVVKKRDISQYSTTNSGKKLKDLCLARFVRTFQADSSENRVGKHNLAISHIESLEPELIAHITCNSIIDCMMSNASEQTVVVTIGKLIEDELRHRYLKNKNSRYINYIKKKVRQKDPSTYYRQRFNFRRKAEFVGLEYESLPVTTIRKIGLYCYHTFLASNPNVLERVMFKKGRKTKYKLVPTTETLEWIETNNTGFWQNNPMFLPFTVPPRNWVNIREGIFSDDFKGSVPMVKDQTLSPHILESINKHQMPKVYKAINALQRTAWKVNKNILNVVQEFQHMSSSYPLIPSAEKVPEPLKPFDIKTNEQARKEYSKLRAKTYQEEITRAGKRIHFKLLLELVELFKDVDAFWFGHNMDFRSRIYPLTTFLSNQGDSLSKALLQFADPQPLGKTGAYWLMVHGANCYGEDKLSLDDRVKWVKDNENKIIQTYTSPLDYLWWKEADSPWQFLAFCFEYGGYLNEGEAFLSSIPVQMDGSANGLQHYSALYLDENNNVNLCPNVLPDDLYTSVAHKVNELVNKDYLEGHELAKDWLGKIDRKLVKRPVMTKCYSVTKNGIANQILDVVKKARENGKVYDFENDFSSAKYLTNIIWQAMKEAMPSADKGMDWFKDCAELCIKHNVDLKFITPIGFPFFQFYRKPKMKRIDSIIYNKFRVKTRHTMQFKNPVHQSDVIDSRKVRQSIAPNSIHALDASHLMAVVNSCLDAGIDSFSMVHDSYGVHANRVEMLNRIIREEFVNQYTKTDVINSFYKAVKKALPKGVEVPKPPEKGNLDINNVKHSDYFFS